MRRPLFCLPVPKANRVWPQTSRGFTMLELLTVVAVIAILVALLLPAVQQAREAARRMSCKSKMRQLGIAMHAYHDVHRLLPSGVAANGTSAFAAMLPHLDQTAIYRRIDFLHSVFDDTNRELRESVPLPILWCPSDISNVFPNSTNFVANNGSGKHVDGRFEGLFTVMNSDHYFFKGGPISCEDVTDGLSNTAAFSELLVADDSQNPRRAVWEAPASTDVDSLCDACQSLVTSQQIGNPWDRGRPWLDGAQLSTLYDHSQTPNRLACTENGTVPLGLFPAASNHSGGVNVCFGDGSTRFVNDSIDRIVWRAVGTRRSGETVADF